LTNLTNGDLLYKTINLKPETHHRLKAFKYLGLTYDEVIEKLLDLITQEDFFQHLKKEYEEEFEGDDV